MDNKFIVGDLMMAKQATLELQEHKKLKQLDLSTPKNSQQTTQHNPFLKNKLSQNSHILNLESD